MECGLKNKEYGTKDVEILEVVGGGGDQISYLSQVSQAALL